MLRRAVELGVDLIDTADSYGPHVSEQLIAEALAPYPDGLVIATKGGLERTGPGAWPRNGRPEHLRAACEGSLKRLGVERIDLYQLHRHDPEVPYEESVGALKDAPGRGEDQARRRLQRQPRAARGGPRDRRGRRASRTASASPTARSADVLAVCERDGIGFLPWAPLDGGSPAQDAAVGEIAERHDTTPFGIAIAWLLRHSPVILPIPGTGSVAHLEENVAAAAIELDDDEMQRLDALAG